MARPDGQVWDTSSLLNLLATGHAEEILSNLARPSCVVRQMHEAEVLFLRPYPDDPGPDELQSVDLSPLLSSGLLIEVELSESEVASLVEFATEMDDGEARSLAVAFHRGYGLFTDDRIPLRHARALTPPVPTLTTPDWIKSWSESKRIPATTLSEALRRVETCARYRPRNVHPLKSWWDSHL